MPVTLVDKIENDYTFVGNDGPVLYFRTDLNAPKGRLIAIDIAQAGARRTGKRSSPRARQRCSASIHRRQSLRRQLPEGRAQRRSGSSTRTASSSATSSCPASARAGGFGGKRDRHRDVLRVLQLRHAAERLSLRRRHRREAARLPRQGDDRILPTTRSSRSSTRQQGRHQGADVPRVQEGPQARRQQPDAALRLRRLQHLR